MAIKTASKRTLTLIALSLAAVWTLWLHGRIVHWAMTEPASIEHRSDDARAPAGGSRANSAAHPTSGDRSVTEPSQLTSDTAGFSKLALRTNPNPKLGWTHVMFAGVLLGSCVTIFAVLVWAAVALNREDV